MNTDHLPGKPTDHDDTVICACLHRTEAEIREAVARLGLETFEDVAAAILAGSGCTTCRPEVEAILEESPEPGEPAPPPENVDDDQRAASAAGRTSPDRSSI